jgi:hypothetical protein
VGESRQAWYESYLATKVEELQEAMILSTGSTKGETPERPLLLFGFTFDFNTCDAVTNFHLDM